jgi:hypothetical protein
VGIGQHFNSRQDRRFSGGTRKGSKGNIPEGQGFYSPTSPAGGSAPPASDPPPTENPGGPPDVD